MSFESVCRASAGALVGGVLLLWLCVGLIAAGAEAKYDVSMFRTYFDCPPCERSECEVPRGCELVEGPGVCACCLTCAREEGDSCGVTTERCGAGLRCNPPDRTLAGFELLLEGKGRCEPIEVFPGFPAVARRSKWPPRERYHGYP